MRNELFLYQMVNFVFFKRAEISLANKVLVIMKVLHTGKWSFCF